MRYAFCFCLVLCIPLVFCQNPPAAAVTGYLDISLDNFQSPRSWNSYFNAANLAPGVIIQAVPLIATSSSLWTSWDNPDLSWAQGANFGNNIFVNWPINGFMVNITNPMHFLTLDIHVEMTTIVGQLKYDFGPARALTLTDADFPDLRNRQRLPAQFAGGETLNLYLSYNCSQPFYYGISCAIYCQPQTNTSADVCFNCNPTNGTKICCNNTIFDPSNGCQRIVESTSTTQQDSTTVSVINCPAVCYSTLTTSAHSYNCSSIPPTVDDKETLYFWLMIGAAALALISLLIVIILLCCCCVYYRKAKDHGGYSPRYQYRPPNDVVYPETKPPPPMAREPATTRTSRYDATASSRYDAVDRRPESDASQFRRDEPLQYSAPKRRTEQQRPRVREQQRPREPSFDPYANTDAENDAENDAFDDDSTTFDGYQAPAARPPHVYGSGTVTKAAARPISYV